MKKKYLIALSSLFLSFSALQVNAQYFGFTVDTAKLVTEGNEDDPDAFLKLACDITNIHASDSFQYKWKFLNPDDRPSSWSFKGFCDNITCYPGTHPWVTGEEMTSRFMQPGDTSDFYMQIGLPKSIAENTSAIFKFRVTVNTQVDTGYFWIIKDSATSINVIPLDDKRVSIYPNPSNGTIHLFVNGELNAQRASIYNMNGQQIMNVGLNNDSETYLFNTKDLAAGTYLVQLFDGNNSVITTRKFINK